MTNSDRSVLIRIVALVAIGLVVLGGCATEQLDKAGPRRVPSEERAEERAAENEPDVDPVVDDDPEIGYIGLLDAVGVATPDDGVAIELGEAICDGWDNGVSFDMTVFNMTAGGLSASDAGSIMGAASLYLCPQHLSAATAWSEA